MSLDDRLAPWSGVTFRHIKIGASYDVLDFRYAGRGTDNRWNEPGEPALSLAGDVGVVIAEFGRHFADALSPALIPATASPTVYRLDIVLERVLDLRDPAVWRDLSLRDAPGGFLEHDIARATARFLRRTTAAQALLAPSVAFHNDLSRWVLVVFLDTLPPDPATFIRAVSVAGPLPGGPGERTELARRHPRA